ncbi:transposase [Prevotella sp. LMAG:51]|uniref:transposase n=1 Tax=Prevotella sp. LMAG:51 TaxID=1969564 RepID=UPI00257FDD3B|nr:transposase [Prevotella sp. LMAG:51]
MSKKLYISLIFSNLVVLKTLSSNHRMYNLYTKFVKILEICKQFSEYLVNESGNVPRRGLVPKFSDLEVVALSLTAETENIDSEKWLFDYKLQEYKDNIPNLISRRQFNDRRKKTADCSIYGDKGYIGADVQLDLFETAHIRLECPYRLNQNDWKPTFIPFAKARKRIETIFSQLTDQFLVIRNYAKITNGLFARIIGKISALTILQYVNFINDKPIGRIKYALN